MRPELEKLAKKEWYIQGIAAKPGILTPFASMDIMLKGTGFTYQVIVGFYKNGYGDWKYLEEDLKRHADIILKKLAENPKYLEEKRQQYNKEFEAIAQTLKKSESAKSMGEKELFQFLPKLQTAIATTVGTSHMLESISLRLEKEIRQALKKKTAGKELNKDFSILTSPVTRSFVSKKEDLLWIIKKAPKEEQKKLVEEFISRFYWVESSYSGMKRLTPENILKEAKEMKTITAPNFDALKEQKKQLFEKYGFTEREKQLVYWTEFLIDWQDDRKEKILRGVYALDIVFHELSKRHNIKLKLLQQLLPSELEEAIKSKSAEKIGLERIPGSIFVIKPEKTDIYTGKDFQEFEKTIKKEQEEIEVIMGSSASLGTASGPVKVCTTIESLEKVKKGDILVASMTRPEYVSAMKKAAAIVTDEGGVLCHAAIVSRELGIPCVVGTRIATQALKDGDIVEVKANHGSVRKL